MSYHLAPEIFFLIKDGQVVLWNCTTHEQYILDQAFFSEMLFISQHHQPHHLEIFNQLKDSGAITTKKTTNPWGWDILSQLFHIGTKNVPTENLNDSAISFYDNYLNACEQAKYNIPNFFQEKNLPIIDLPTPSLELKHTTLSSTLLTRKTCRDFNGAAITLQELSDVLYSAFGLIHGEWMEAYDLGFKIAGIRKSSPSSGGVHAEEVYLTIYNVTQLEAGLYYYRPQDHKLNLLKAGNFENEVIDFNKKQFYSKGLAFGIYITARFDKYWWKYKHSRTYRIMLLDIGHVSQTFLLAATALGLNTWITGAFDDNEVEKFLGIDGYTESVILYVGAGYGSAEAFPIEFYNNQR